jgi:thioredoxin-like negative regulator of GroEL
MKFWRSLFIVFFLVQSQVTVAQDQMLSLAFEFLTKQDYPKAIELFTQVYENTPNDNKLIDGYTTALLATKDYKLAEKVLKEVLKRNKGDKNYTLKLAQLYIATGEQKKADKLLKDIIEQTANSETETRALGNKFQSLGMTDKTIELFLKARKNSGNNYLFAEEMAAIYNKKGDFEQALNSLIDLAALQPLRLENVKISLPRILTSKGKKDTLKAKLIERITAQPDEVVYIDLLAWHYIQEHDYESAFIQVKALDFRLKENGKYVLDFAKTASKEKEFDAALQAYDLILEKGKERPEYVIALTDKITMLKSKLELNGKFQTSEVENLIATYEQYFKDYPETKSTEARRFYASVIARYTDDIDKAINVLKEMITLPNMQNVLRGQAKLDLGDYELIAGNNWQSTLLYSQVDKDFKNDMLGEEARFRNAKLSYYIGDYAWAQGQLDVLKASTSELIANDALNLSVLITENMPADSNLVPLEMYSRADLMIFRNKYSDAQSILDSLTSFYSEHPLSDDILMSRAAIARKLQDYPAAVGFYKTIYDKYKEDILADDALFQSAQINEMYLNNKIEAQSLYERIILDYSGSSFIGEARKAFRVLRGDAPDVEQ